MANHNRNILLADDTKVLVGILKDLQDVSTMSLATIAFTPASLSAYVQRRVDAAHAVVTTHAAWVDAIKAYKEVNAEVAPVVAGLRQLVVNKFGAASPKLADFGFVVHKRVTQTPEQKAAAVAKRNATRAARHTMGPKAKKAVKGKVTGIVVTPVTAPASPEAPSGSPGAVTAPGATAPGATAPGATAPGATAPATAPLVTGPAAAPATAGPAPAPSTKPASA